MKKIFGEFKEFISRGNVVDMAVGIMIGAAFKAIVDSLVNDIISPIIGLIAQDNFANLKLEFWGISIGYGAFMMQVLNFFIVAAALSLFCFFTGAVTAHLLNFPAGSTVVAVNGILFGICSVISLFRRKAK